jgi:hypothetical protein
MLLLLQPLDWGEQLFRTGCGNRARIVWAGIGRRAGDRGGGLGGGAGDALGLPRL